MDYLCGTRKTNREVETLFIPINFFGRYLLSQWGTQINIPVIPRTAHEEIRGDMVDAPGESIDKGDQV